MSCGNRYRLCKYFNTLFWHQRSYRPWFWRILWHAYKWWINNTAYHMGEAQIQILLCLFPPFMIILLQKNIPAPPHLAPFFLSHPSFPTPPTPLLGFPFVSIETRSCPMHSSLVAVSFPAGWASGWGFFFFFPIPNKREQHQPAT